MMHKTQSVSSLAGILVFLPVVFAMADDDEPTSDRATSCRRYPA